LVIHQVFLGERQCFHNRSRLVLGLSIDHENNAFAIAARIPLADFPVEVSFTVALISSGITAHDLLGGFAMPGSLDDDEFCGFRYSEGGTPELPPDWDCAPDCDCARPATGSTAAHKKRDHEFHLGILSIQSVYLLLYA
jgi:hypothetical protein